MNYSFYPIFDYTYLPDYEIEILAEVSGVAQGILKNSNFTDKNVY